MLLCFPTKPTLIRNIVFILVFWVLLLVARTTPIICCYRRWRCEVLVTRSINQSLTHHRLSSKWRHRYYSLFSWVVVGLPLAIIREHFFPRMALLKDKTRPAAFNNHLELCSNRINNDSTTIPSEDSNAIFMTQ